MVINKEIEIILREFKIDRSQGLLALLGIYFDLDIDSTCSEEVVKAINLTKIVEKDYQSNTIKWNIPLFEGQEVAFDWVKGWVDKFGELNPERRGTLSTSIKRMKDFFAQHPEIRKEDVLNATELYFKTQATTGFKYLMKSHKFIFDGAGAMKNSTLLEYCDKVKDTSAPSSNNLKGKIIS